MQQHFILCGLGKVGWRVLEQLRSAGAAVVAIDNRCTPDDPRLAGAVLVSGDCRQPDVLQRAGLDRAHGVLILTSDDLISLSTALLVRHLHPTVHVVVRLFNQSLIARLGSSIGNMQALSTSALAAPMLALIARTGGTLGLVRLGQDRQQQLAEIAISADSAFVGQRLAEVAQRHDVAVVAHLPAGQPPRFFPDLAADVRLSAADCLVVCGEPAKVAPLIAGGDNDSLPELLWAGMTRRFSRVFARGLGLVDWPVKVCTAIFLGVIVVSVAIFRVGMENEGLIDAFYRTISLLATGAEMRDSGVEPNSWQKAFISGLRLVGTALTAAFTAILTNYLIRANLRGALAIRRIPESGHIVVCGLGNVGFRVVEDLLHHREQVVVIEANASSPFIPTARRLGAAVIVGNGTIPETLRQAHVATARAIVATTNNELINLEVALLVRELAPKQRVVLRLTDSQLAQSLRQSASVRLAVSIPELAAPAFVAAMFGERVHGMFQVAGRTLAMYDWIVPDSIATDQPTQVRDLAAEHRLLPVALTDRGGNPKLIGPDETLAVGDQLTVIVTLEDLQKMMKHEAKICDPTDVVRPSA